jgi:hypothetical protein
MTTPRTYAYTWTQTRLETIQDQFRYLLLYADIADAKIDQVVHAVGQKALQAVEIYGYDASGLRVVEVELRVDWELNAKLTLSAPTIRSGLPGWRARQAPEVRVAGRRFAEVAREEGLNTSYWVLLTPSIRRNEQNYSNWRKHLGLSHGGVPGWKEGTSTERSERLLDINEADIFIRRAGS